VIEKKNQKVTATWIRKHFPFLEDLMNTSSITGKQRVTLTICFAPVEVTQPWHDAVSRFTSLGKISSQYVASRYAGSYESSANNPGEFISESPIEGKTVNPGCFYAVMDKLEYSGMRDLTLYLDQADTANFSQELKNQLAPLLLTQ
jgi:hypothetical protein